MSKTKKTDYIHDRRTIIERPPNLESPSKIRDRYQTLCTHSFLLVKNIEFCIFFVDKMDGSFWEKSGEEKDLKTEFMALWGGILEEKCLEDVVVIFSSII